MLIDGAVQYGAKASPLKMAFVAGEVAMVVAVEVGPTSVIAMSRFDEASAVVA
jgi:hypothetical protein